jgi:hypothetical protein
VPFLHGIRDIVIKDKAVPKTQKEWTFGKTDWMKLEDFNRTRTKV